MKMLVSWTILIDGITSGGSQYAESWDDVCPYLTKLREQAGTVCLDLVDAPDPGPISMQLVAENRIYLVTLLEATDDDTYVRSYTNPAALSEMVEVLGDRWDARQLTHDFELVMQIFKEFCDSGEVSRQWLS
ncbi:hypothetical protein ACCD10_12400 [Pseudomonas sp. Pseusp122]|uniref:DUF6911 family protein n=1 Tax=unclassified Pseudomonas TaxID=196821 RepID=UPI0039A5C88E